ncbi:hypothetical protein [Micromonospora deserti]|uniref:hypothetical protein n=1 Tax=Micromonospora deserti TaxID=2070366 RepID=UPI0034DD0263
MQGQRSNDEAYYRCRYAQEYALANKIDQTRNIYYANATSCHRLTRSSPPPSPRTDPRHHRAGALRLTRKNDRRNLADLDPLDYQESRMKCAGRVVIVSRTGGE